ncbi:DNA polymerase [Campylobacterota bacterium]|nr:DNA polymerase [Campylobacterota bacterium]
MKTITIIDTFGFLFRSFHAMPALKSSSGFPTGMLTGFINYISQLIKGGDLDLLVFTADSPGGSFRNELFDGYKANRKEPDPALKMQIPIALDFIGKMGFTLVQQNGFEADDVIATITKRALAEGYFVRIVSSDKDMYQLIDDGKCVIYDAVKQKMIDSAGCVAKFGVAPRDFTQFQAILGDSSDNVPGVKGIGEKGAADLINRFKTLEAIYENLEKISPERMRSLLEASRENAFLSRRLVTLETAALTDFDCATFTIPTDPIGSISDLLASYDIRANLRRTEKKPFIGATAQPSHSQDQPQNGKTDQPFNSALITDETELYAIIDRIPQGAIVAFDTETDSLDVRKAHILGFSFAWESDTGYYAAIAHRYLGAPAQISLEAAKRAIAAIFAKSKVIAQNAKFDLHILHHALGLKNLTVENDTLLIAWLINPAEANGLDDLAARYLSHESISFKSVTKGLNSFAEVELTSAARYASEDAVMTLRLYFLLLDELSARDPALVSHLRAVELPFMSALMSMEDNGLMIDAPFLERLQTKMHDEIAERTELIYTLAGGSFNINSPQQLGAILFERLGLNAAKKTKTGYSTDESVLSELDHPIANEILSYRELFKLRSTYIEPLLLIASRSKRVHTHLTQTGTATGRLSSSEPNLQNIPTRTETGRQIRRAFVAAEGCKLLSADYSQIELRLLAHFSGDSTMIEAFKNHRDIHAETAKLLFANGAEGKRHIAKAVNFGLIYGMGQRKLATDVGISSAEAKEVITNYFAKFPTTKSYLESIKTEVHQNGFVTTLLGRRRNFNFANAGDRFVAAHEREAVNTRFQGSAADLIKLAMLDLHNRFKDDDRVKILLQIHDELLFEIREDFVSEASAIVAEAMKNAYKLTVPLDVSVAIADNWAALK